MSVWASLDAVTRFWPAHIWAVRQLRSKWPALQYRPGHRIQFSAQQRTRIHDFVYFLDTREQGGVSRLFLDGLDYGRDEVLLLQRALKAGDIFVDVGANIGLFLPPASRAIGPSGRVIAFEPAPGHLTALRRTVRANRLRNVTVVPAAVSDREGTVQLYLSTRNTGDHRIMPDAEESRDTVMVPLTTIDRTLQQQGIGASTPPIPVKESD